jgi:succinoglycan biosynthesis protein ExoM
MTRPISVMIPTLRRPEGLERAIRSVLDQEAADELVQAIVVVDNSPEGSARRFVDRLRRRTAVPLLYLHEPTPGVATARNSGLEACHAPYVAFLDDDEEAPPEWLAHLFLTHHTCKADVTFGPVRAVTPETGWTRPYLDRFFSRLGPAKSGVIDVAYGCGNSLMTRATALGGTNPFNVDMDRSGGEDDHLFERIREDGGVFAWAAEAHVFEHVPAHRANLYYTLRRAFSYGQTPARMCFDRTPRDWAGVLRWMCIGSVQALVFGAAWVVGWALQRPARAELADRAARGLGKIVWWRTPQFYGLAEIARTDALVIPSLAAE